ncbi:MAG: hypothetical protein Q9160_003029 [Pyrenula sp. 1 TL-2023]
MSDRESTDHNVQGPSEFEKALQAFVKPLVLDETTVHRIAYEFSQVYKECALNSDEQFLPTPVTKLPTGNETGSFLSIDVGGSNLRVAFIDLLGEEADQEISTNGKERSRETIKKAQRQRVQRRLEKAWPIGEHLKMDKVDDLFAWIGDCIAEVVADRLSSSDVKHKKPPEELEMGITFSFPMMQDELSSATLMPMGKGFAMTADLNLKSVLLAGYVRHTRRPSSPSNDDEPSAKRRKLGPLPKLKIAAITNDTVATLSSLAYSVKSLPNSRVAAGIIVGTGVNATIPMPLTSLGAQKASLITSKAPQATSTVVNTEITIAGACAPLIPITTSWDQTLDEACARPGFQPLEYMTGGRYIGELVRIIFHSYMTTTHDPPILSAQLPANIVHSYSFTTTFVSMTVARARSDDELCGELKRVLPPPESSSWSWSPQSAHALRLIARLVQSRSAALIAAATVGLLACVGEISLSEPSPLPNNLVRTTARVDSPAPEDVKLNSTPLELVIAYTGGIIQHFPGFKEGCQRWIDRLVMKAGPQEGGKSVFLREARDGGIIGAGVLAGMESKEGTGSL